MNNFTVRFVRQNIDCGLHHLTFNLWGCISNRSSSSVSWDVQPWWAAVLLSKSDFSDLKRKKKMPEGSIQETKGFFLKTCTCITCQGWVCGPASSSRCLWSVVHLGCHTASVWWIEECGRRWAPLRLWCYWQDPSETCLCTGPPETQENTKKLVTFDSRETCSGNRWTGKKQRKKMLKNIQVKCGS